MNTKKYDYSSFTNLSTNTSWTAPSNGIITWQGSHSDSNRITISKASNSIISLVSGSYGAGNSTGSIPVYKGETYSLTISVLTTRFWAQIN